LSRTVPPAPGVIRALTRASLVGGIVTLAAGALVLAGWAFDVAILRQVHPSLPAMKVNAALACILAGAALTFRNRGGPRRWPAGVLATGVSLIGGLTLLEAIPGLDLGIDELLFSDETDPTAPGRMSPATAVSFVLVGLAIALMDARAGVAQWLALGGGLLALLGLLASLYGTRSLFDVGEYEAMALHPAATLVLCCGSILFARPERGVMEVVSSATAGGSLARRLLPAALLVPAVAGGLLQAGEAAGWFDLEHEIALFASISVVGFAALTWWTASAVLRFEVARRGAEDAVRASEEDLATTLDSIGDAVIATDVAGRVTRMNPVAESLTGWPVAEARGRPLGEVLRGSDDTLVARDGGARAIAKRAAPIRQGAAEARGEVIVFRDMTAERRAEAELRHSQARFARLADSGIVGIVVADAGGRFVDVNDAFARMVGSSRAELLAGPTSWADLTAPGTRGVAETARARGLAEPSEQELVRRDGARAPVLIGVAALGDETIAVVADLRERRERERAEQALRATEEQLRESQKLQAVGSLAGGIAHDFNNVLTVILSFGHLLERPGITERVREEGVREIVRAADRAVDLTARLLAFSRRKPPEPMVVELGEVVARMSGMLRRVIGEDIELELAAAPDLYTVFVDPAQIEQVLLNLVVNARDAMPHGGRLTIATANVALDAAFAAEHAGVSPGPHAALIVRDTGVGMDAATRARIFEPLFTTKPPGAGTGLGLAIVTAIVAQSRGAVRVDSEPGRGAAFTVYLPRHAPRPAIAPRPSPLATREPAGGSETILLVEDDDQVRRLARGVLRGHGYTVLDAANADEALAAIARHEGAIHLLLSDVVMPRLSGPQLAERVRALRPETRVLFMSGHAAAAPGEAPFIEKPLTPARLLAKVRDVLD
jgi:PAS domain S-box-containing protein